MNNLFVIITTLLPMLTFGQTHQWPRFSCNSIIHQVSPLILKTLNTGRVLGPEIEMTWIASDPKTNVIYPKNSTQKLSFKSTVDSFVKENLFQSDEMKILSYRPFPVLGAASLVFSTQNPDLIKYIICALPLYSIVIFYKGEVALNR